MLDPAVLAAVGTAGIATASAIRALVAHQRALADALDDRAQRLQHEIARLDTCSAALVLPSAPAGPCACTPEKILELGHGVVELIHQPGCPADPPPSPRPARREGHDPGCSHLLDGGRAPCDCSSAPLDPRPAHVHAAAPAGSPQILADLRYAWSRLPLHVRIRHRLHGMNPRVAAAQRATFDR